MLEAPILPVWPIPCPKCGCPRSKEYPDGERELECPVCGYRRQEPLRILCATCKKSLYVWAPLYRPYPNLLIRPDHFREGAHPTPPYESFRICPLCKADILPSESQILTDRGVMP